MRQGWSAGSGAGCRRRARSSPTLRLPPYGLVDQWRRCRCVDRQLRHGGRRAGARTARWSLVACAEPQSSTASPRSNVHRSGADRRRSARVHGVDQRQRRLFLSVLAVLGVIGFILVFGEHHGPPREVVSAEGSSRRSRGWVSEQFALEWQPIAGNPIAEVFDKWTVAVRVVPVRATVARRVARDRGIVAHVQQAVAADSGLTINRDEFGDDTELSRAPPQPRPPSSMSPHSMTGGISMSSADCRSVCGDDRLIDGSSRCRPRCQSGSDQPERCVASSMSGCGRRTAGRRGRARRAAQRDQLRRRAS